MSGSEGDGRRHPRNMEGLLKFCVENTKTEDASGASQLGPMSDEEVSCASPCPSDIGSLSNVVSETDTARKTQDVALNALGLYRYCVPGDGNCMFRAVASQLGVLQEKFCPLMRSSAVNWMRDHLKDLEASGLIDGAYEVEEVAKPGVWPSQAALVALANILEINIAVIQGGDQGNLDIQHITPFDTPAMSESQRGIILTYLYNGHYDGVVQQPVKSNPEYKAWLKKCKREIELNESAARALSEEFADTEYSNMSNRRDQPPSYEEAMNSSNSNILEQTAQVSAVKQERIIPVERSVDNKNAQNSLQRKNAVRQGKCEIPVEHVPTKPEKTIPVQKGTAGLGTGIPSKPSSPRAARLYSGKDYTTQTVKPEQPFPLVRESTKARIIPVKFVGKRPDSSDSCRSTSSRMSHTATGISEDDDQFREAERLFSKDDSTKKLHISGQAAKYASSRGKAVNIPVQHYSTTGGRNQPKPSKNLPSQSVRNPPKGTTPGRGGGVSRRNSHLRSAFDSFTDMSELEDSDISDYLKPFQSRHDAKDVERRLSLKGNFRFV